MSLPCFQKMLVRLDLRAHKIEHHILKTVYEIHG